MFCTNDILSHSTVWCFGAVLHQGFGEYDSQYDTTRQLWVSDGCHFYHRWYIESEFGASSRCDRFGLWLVVFLTFGGNESAQHQQLIVNHCLIFQLFESHSWRKQPHSCSDRCGCECGPLATESCRWCRRPAGQVASPELPGASYGYTIWCTSWLVIVIVAPFWYNYATFGTLVAAVWC